MLLTVKHKYKWKTDMKITIAVLAVVVPVVLYFLTNLQTFAIFGGISIALAVWITIINNRRLNKGELTATVNNEGVLTISGAGLSDKNNKGKTTEIVGIGYDQKAYNPTLILTFGEHSQMRLPKRIAQVPELNEWLRHNLPKTVSNFSSEEAIELFEEIFVAEADRKFTQQLRERQAKEALEKKTATVSGEVKAATIEEELHGTPLVISDADRRKAKAKNDKEAKAARIAASVAALNAEENKLNRPALNTKTDYTNLEGFNSPSE